MLIAEASVATERAGRYLVQLCRHIDQVARAHPQMRARAEWSDDHGVISIGPAQCVLRAETDALRLHAEAPDEQSLHQIEQRVADRLQQVGRRDRLAVTWTPPSQGVAEQVPHAAEHGKDTHMTDPPRHPDPDPDTDMRYDGDSRAGIPRWVKVAGIVLALVALLVAIAMLVGGGGGHGPGRHF